MNKTLAIQSTQKNYNVVFIEQANELIKEVAQIRNAIIVIDQVLVALYPQLINQLQALHPVISLAATEEAKTLTGAEKVLLFLQQSNATKNSTIIAIGGGIIQDIASFAAHLYYRGINFIYIPTTLLAMSDSCIGAKCGLNFNGYKNQIGAFHQPEKVIIWPEFLQTLNDEAIFCGYGEIFKLALIAGRPQYNELKTTLEQEGIRNPYLPRHIFQSLEIKKSFIEVDEFDTGIRRILNYGHTFGHALELQTNYAMAHGIAVARGIDIANFLALKMGLLKQSDYDDIHEFITTYFHCDQVPVINVDELIANAKKDKKVANSQINMILLEEPGKTRIEAIPFDEQLCYFIREYFADSFLYSLA